MISRGFLCARNLFSYYIIGARILQSRFPQKRIFAVWISGKYIVPKSALVDFLVDDFAFEIIHKSMCI